MRHDAAKLRLIRESMGMTQEKLGILSSVSERTVQRAEAGARMHLETLNDFAAALEVPLTELVHDPENARDNQTALRRVVAGRTLLDDLARAGAAIFDCEVDPQPSEMSTVLALVSLIECRLPSWDYEQRPVALSLREKIERGATISTHLTALSEAGVSLYGATSWIKARVPCYDVDEGFYVTHARQPYQRVTTLQLLICRSTDDKIYRKAATNWGLEEEPKPRSFDDLDEDVPF